MSRATPAMKAADLRHFRDEQGRDLIDLPAAPLPPEDTPAPVRFLAPFDPTLLTNCRRTGILPDDTRQAIFSGVTGWTIGVFLVDGQVVGRWRYEGDQIATYPLVTLTPRQRHELQAESAKLGDFYERDSPYAAPAETGVFG